MSSNYNFFYNYRFVGDEILIRVLQELWDTLYTQHTLYIIYKHVKYNIKIIVILEQYLNIFLKD